MRVTVGFVADERRGENEEEDRKMKWRGGEGRDGKDLTAKQFWVAMANGCWSLEREKSATMQEQLARTFC